MFNLISLGIGGFALLCAAIAFVPLMGWANWLIVPMAIVGLGFGLLSRSNLGRNLNLLVIVVGLFRLMIGGGIF